MSTTEADLMKRLREDAQDIFLSALDKCRPGLLLESFVHRSGKWLRGADFRIDLKTMGRILVLSYGKASIGMAKSFCTLISPMRSETWVVHPAGFSPSLPGVINLEAMHPIPDHRSFQAGEAILKRVREVGRGDLVVHLISGGGSALLAAPLEELLSAPEKAALHRLLLSSGLGIADINSVRKHFSALKAGRLALASPDATHLSLILSDVPEGVPFAVAGGPTLPDPTRWSEVLSLLGGSGIYGELSFPLRKRLETGGLPETPKPGDPRFDGHPCQVVGTCADLRKAAAGRARELGYQVKRLAGSVEGSTESTLDRFMGLASEEECHAPLCVLGGGEVRGRGGKRSGTGGRAQELAALAAERLEGRNDAVFLAAGSDGIDGNSPAAGAIIDGTTRLRSRRAGQDWHRLRNQGDTYHLLRSIDDVLVTGPTGNNLRDLYLLLHRPRASDGSAGPIEIGQGHRE